MRHADTLLALSTTVATGGILYIFWGESVTDKAHLILLAWVLIVEVYMLYRISQEARERKRESDERASLVDNLSSFRVSLGRANYLSEIKSEISECQTWAAFVSATMSTSQDPRQKRIIDAVVARQNAVPAYTHRGLVSESLSTLPGAIELLFKTRVEVRFSKIAEIATQIRFFIRDSSVSVIGIASNSGVLGEANKTDQSFTVRSSVLCNSLQVQFDEIWNQSRDPWDYFTEVIRENSTDAGFNKARVLAMIDSDTTGVTSEFLEQNCRAFQELPD